MNEEIKEKYELAIKYFKGIEVEQNYEKAYKIFNELVEKYNYEKANSYIGAMYYWGDYLEQNYEKAYNIFKKLVEKYNDTDSKLYIADMYRWGQYVEKDYKKAYELYKELAEDKKNIDAKFYIGLMNYYGLYVKRNYKKAFEIFNELMEKYNKIDAEFFIAKMYYYGQYVEQDNDKALKIFEEIDGKEGYDTKPYILEIKEGLYKELLLEFKYINKRDFYELRNNYLEFLEKENIGIKDKDVFHVSILVKLTNAICKQLELDEDINENDENDAIFLNCNYSTIEEMNHVFDIYDANTDYNYLLNWKIYIFDVKKESLNNLHEWMKVNKQEYKITQFDGVEYRTIIELNSNDIDVINESPIINYLNTIENASIEDDNIIFKIDNLKPHIMIYLSKMFQQLSDNNKVDFKDYIAITPYRSFYDIWESITNKEIIYICKFRIDIFHTDEIPNDVLNKTLKQIIDFLKGFNVKCFIEKNDYIDDMLTITIYPKKIEEIQFVHEVLDLNDIDYLEWSGDETNIDETALWIFSAPQEEKEQVGEMLKMIDKDRVDRLKELGAPEIIIKHDTEPAICNYGIITKTKLQEQIENILQSLKLNYLILDKNEEVISEQKNFNNN